VSAVPPSADPRTITVTGTGRVAAVPDLADIRLGATTTSATVEEARATDARAMAAVTGALKELGIAAPDIQTANLSLSPAYDYSSNTNPPRLTGYTLTNTLAVTIRDLAIVGRAIDGALLAGATSVDSVAFRVEDSSAGEQQAREQAVADARAKAETLARAAGVAITGIASISESAAPLPYPVFRGEMAKMAMADAPTPVETGVNEISITVVVSYVIE